MKFFYRINIISNYELSRSIIFIYQISAPLLLLLTSLTLYHIHKLCTMVLLHIYFRHNFTVMKVLFLWTPIGDTWLIMFFVIWCQYCTIHCMAVVAIKSFLIIKSSFSASKVENILYHKYILGFLFDCDFKLDYNMTVSIPRYSLRSHSLLFRKTTPTF